MPPSSLYARKNYRCDQQLPLAQTLIPPSSVSESNTAIQLEEFGGQETGDEMVLCWGGHREKESDMWGHVVLPFKEISAESPFVLGPQGSLLTLQI